MIDTMMYSLLIPAGSYAANVPIQIPIARGPAVVRDGYGTAKLKRVFSCYVGGGGIRANVEIKNSSWNDSMINNLVGISSSGNYTILDSNGPCIQNGANCELTANSAFTVTVTPLSNATTTAPNRVIVLVDIDYPQVSAVANPRNEDGVPATITRFDTIATSPSVNDAVTWNVFNVDMFKAGYRYLMTEAGFSQTSSGTSLFGMLALSGTANQAGLVQIIPVAPYPAGATRYSIDYSTVMVKGPMTIEYALIDTADTVANLAVALELDFIKRQ